jgi:hypothetical protein
MKDWQFNVLFFTAVGGAVFLLLAPVFNIHTGGPGPATGVGAILTFILTQKLEKNSKEKDDDTRQQ